MWWGAGSAGGGDGDAVAGGVVAQVVEGAQPDGGGRDGGRGVLAGQQAGGEADGVADGGGIDAEQGTDDLQRQVQVLPEAGGQHVIEQVDLAGRRGALGVDAAAAAAGVEVLLAAGAEREVQSGGQGGQVRGVHAGQRGVAEDVLAAAARVGGFWFRRRGGAGDGREGVVPLAVEAVAG